MDNTILYLKDTCKTGSLLFGIQGQYCTIDKFDENED